MYNTRSQIKQALIADLKHKSVRAMKTRLTKAKNEALAVIQDIKTCKSNYYLGESKELQHLEQSRWIEEVETLQRQLNAYQWDLNALLKALENKKACMSK